MQALVPKWRSVQLNSPGCTRVILEIPSATSRQPHLARHSFHSVSVVAFSRSWRTSSIVLLESSGIASIGLPKDLPNGEVVALCAVIGAALSAVLEMEGAGVGAALVVTLKGTAKGARVDTSTTASVVDAEYGGMEDGREDGATEEGF